MTVDEALAWADKSQEWATYDSERATAVLAAEVRRLRPFEPMHGNKCACCKIATNGPVQCAACGGLGEKRIQDLTAASAALVRKLDAVKPGIDAAFTMAAIHGHVYYSGPRYGIELEALRKLVEL